ncbi:unnamed protein product [Closterium sp. NIES-64]|nr:unnamed protein product [Closterium sp. NIES-64]
MPGTGQFGTVRRCTERLTGARFACKTISKDRLRSEAEQEEVRREVALMQRVGGSGAGETQGVAHPGVVQLRGVFEDEHSVHLVMDLCEGGELFDEVVRRGRLSERDAANVFAQVASAVAHCHARGVLHRDLKPENILLTRDPSAPFSTAPLTTKLADFGLAVPLQSGNRAMGVAGSPFYMAPEVLLGEYALEADVWSLGVILYILLCGAPPFWGPTDKDVFVEVLKGVVGFKWRGVGGSVGGGKAACAVPAAEEPPAASHCRANPLSSLDPPALPHQRGRFEDRLGSRSGFQCRLGSEGRRGGSFCHGGVRLAVA